MSEGDKKQNTTQDSSTSRKRIPLGTRNILTAPKRSGFVRRFVNDKGDRINAFKDAGWSAVPEDGLQVGDPKLGRASSIGSSTNPQVGGGQRAVLMEIPEKYYLEDQAAAQAKISAIENEMKRNSRSGHKDGLSGDVEIS